jgi:hypothetical protein
MPRGTLVRTGYEYLCFFQVVTNSKFYITFFHRKGMIKSLYLCGTVHLDLAGPERLEKVLEVVKPDCIAVESYPELSQDVLEKRKEIAGLDEKAISQKIKDRFGTIEGIRIDSASAILNCAGYEIWTPFEYAKKNDIQIVQIEDKERAQKIIKGLLEDNLDDSFREILKLPPETLKELFDFCYVFRPQEGKDLAETAERNRTFADRIGSLNGRILAIVGADHLRGINPTLPNLLKKYNPVSFKLVNADYLDADGLIKEPVSVKSKSV